MKKITLMAMAMCAMTTSMAQTTLWDGENKDLGSNGGCWTDSSPTVVENPEKDGINTSERCLKFTMTDASKTIKIPFRDWTTPGMNGSRRVSLMIKKSQSENLQIELSDPTNGSDGYWKKVAAWYGGDGTWQKVVFDFSTNGDFDYPGVISITAQTGTVTGEQDVYIDNIVIEPATKVNGTLLSDIADGSLSGDITLEGAWMKGDCQNADGEWVKNDYNDFEKLASKLKTDVTSIDMRGAVLKDAYNAFGDANPNIIIYTDTKFDGDNVAYKDGEGYRVDALKLGDANAFRAPYGFNATSVIVKRSLYPGYNTVYLPFYVSKDDLGAKNIATFDGYTAGENDVVNFKIVDNVDANTPILVEMEDTYAEAAELTFANKYVKELGEDENNNQYFVGTYAPISGEGLYGIADGGTFKKGSGQSAIGAFHAYLNLPSEKSSVKVNYSNGSSGIQDVLGDNANGTSNVYNVSGVKVGEAQGAKLPSGLAKGIYIVNGKKIIVK